MNQDEDLENINQLQPETAEADSENNEEYTEEFLKDVKPFQEQKKKSRRRKIVLSLVLAAGLIAASGYGGYRYLTRGVDDTSESSVDQTATTEPAPPSPGGTYESSLLKLEFDYPEGFRVDDDQIDTLKVLSEPITVKDEFSEPTQAVAVLYITEDKSLLQEYEKQSLSAALDSAKIVYTSPTQAQRPETRLTFLSVGTSAALDSAVVSGGLEYTTGMPVPYADIAAVVPTIEVRFLACEARECDFEKAARIGIDPGDWQSNPNLQQIEKIISSLRIN